MKHGLNLSCQIKSILATYFFAENFIDIFSQVESLCCNKFISAFLSVYFFPDSWCFKRVYTLVNRFQLWVYLLKEVSDSPLCLFSDAKCGCLQSGNLFHQQFNHNFSISFKYCVHIEGIGTTRCVVLHISVFLSSTSTKACNIHHIGGHYGCYDHIML